MSSKNESSKSEMNAGAGTGASTGGQQAAAGRIPMPWELPWFGPDAFARGQEMFARGQEAFARAMSEQVERTQKVMDELTGYEAVAVQRARAAVADLAKLATDSIDYCAKLSAEWRKLALETTRRAAEQAAPRA
jgi:hypothetical protein